MAPFATMILAVPAFLLEGDGVMNWFHTHQSVHSSLIIIISSGLMAFCLNFSIFYVIHSTTAVTFNVAGNLKVRSLILKLLSLILSLSHSILDVNEQVALAVIISWLVFRNPISSLNAFGCAVTLLGCTFYGYVRHKLSQQTGAPRTPRTPRTPRSRMELLPLVNDKLDDKV